MSDVLVTVSGKFQVGDVRDHGNLVGIYRLDADDIILPGKN